MSTKIPFILEIIDGLVKEIGDLKNIIPYDVIKKSDNHYIFTTDEGWDGEINITQIDKKYLEYLTFYPINSNIPMGDVYNVGYNIEEDEFQFKKSTLSSLYRIVKTVLNCCLEFIKTHPDSTLTIFSTPKNEKYGLDDQKFSLYSSISKLNLPPKYRRGNVDLDGEKGLYIGPDYRIKK